MNNIIFIKTKDMISLSKKIVATNSAYKTNYGFVPEKIAEIFHKFYFENAVCVKSKLTTKELDPHSTFIIFDKASVRLCDIIDNSILKNKYEKEFFYIYGDIKESLNYAQVAEIVKLLIEET